MTRRESFWEHVNAALDERRDPLEDALVQECIADEPELALELARLSGRIEALHALRSRRRRRVAAIAATIVLAAAGVYEGIVRRVPQSSVTSVPATPESSEARGAALADRSGSAGGSAVLAFRSEVIVESAESRTVTHFDGQRSWRTRESLLPALSPGTPNTPGLVARIDRISYSR